MIARSRETRIHQREREEMTQGGCELVPRGDAHLLNLLFYLIKRCGQGFNHEGSYVSPDGEVQGSNHRRKGWNQRCHKLHESSRRNIDIANKLAAEFMSNHSFQFHDAPECRSNKSLTYRT